MEEAKQIAVVLGQADTVQQSLIVIALQDAVPQMKGESVVDLLDLELVVGRRQIGALVERLRMVASCTIDGALMSHPKGDV
jgi:hypothetical protein